jgi:hypothetical protein
MRLRVEANEMDNNDRIIPLLNHDPNWAKSADGMESKSIALTEPISVGDNVVPFLCNKADEGKRYEVLYVVDFFLTCAWQYDGKKETRIFKRDEVYLLRRRDEVPSLDKIKELYDNGFRSTNWVRQQLGFPPI